MLLKLVTGTHRFDALWRTIVDDDKVDFADVESLLSDARRHKYVVFILLELLDDLKNAHVKQTLQARWKWPTLFCSAWAIPLSSFPFDLPTNLCARMRG